MNAPVAGHQTPVTVPTLEPPESVLRRLFMLERPPPGTPATRRLRALIAIAAVATVVVDLINLEYAPEGGFSLVVRTVWALLRAIGFLLLMRTVRYGRMAARPFGLILSATTIFAVARLAVPRTGSLVPPWPVVVGFVGLTLLCGLIVWRLYGSPEIEAHLTRRPPRRRVHPWLLTARVAALSYGALLVVPALVAVGTLFEEPRLAPAVAVPLTVFWVFLGFATGVLMPWLSLFVVFDKVWARILLALASLALLVAQPVLCFALLGVDGLLRDGAPFVVAAGLAMYGLWRSRAPIRTT